MPNTSITFPASPAVNQQYTYGTTTYVWTGISWMTYIDSASLMPTNPAAMTRQQFSGTGSQTVFTLAADPGALGNGTHIYINGVYQQKATYTTVTTTLTFSSAPPLGTNNIEVVSFVLSSVGTTDSALVTYLPSGTGAVTRSAQSKMRDTVSVKDFGAVGDGVTDDRNSFINAMASLIALGGGTLLIPKTSSSYRIGNGTTLNISNSSNISIISDGATIALESIPIAAIPANSYAATSAFIYGVGVENLIVKGLRFICYSTIVRQGKGDADFDAYCGLTLAGKNPNFATVETNFRSGISILDCENISISDCYFGTNFWQGIKISSTGYSVLNTGNKNVSITNMVFEGIAGQCVFIAETRNTICDNWIVTDSSQSKFDHVIYDSLGNYDLTVSNMTISGGTVGSYGVPFSCGGYGADGRIYNNIKFDKMQNSFYFSGCDPIYIGANYIGYTRNICVSNIISTNQTVTGATSQIEILITSYGLENISFANIQSYNCGCPVFGIQGTVLGSPHKNINLTNFVIKNSTNVCIPIYGCSDVQITNGQIIDSASGTNAIQLSNTQNISNILIDGISIVNRSISGNSTKINGENTTATGIIKNCNFINYNATVINQYDIYNLSPNILFSNNVSVGRLGLFGVYPLTYESTAILEQQQEKTLTVNSTTPTVLNNTTLVTANTVATSITNFTNGKQGQEITVRVDDANTTFDFTGSSLKGNVGVDFLATSGDVLFAKKQGSNWYCTICNIS